jgi:hypothetical protein
LFADGTAKLGDLNVSKVAKKGLGYTQTGTPYYASPEVWKDKPYDYKSDLWSLGCVLYEMIMLKPPFRAENMEGLFNKVIKGQYPKINDKFSTDLAEITRLLIQVNPDLRPNCGKCILHNLDQLLKNPIIQNKIDTFSSNNNLEEYDIENINLLQTIRVPKNLLYLTDKLPTSNYEKYNEKINKHQSFSNKAVNKKDLLPDIKIASQRNIGRTKREIEGNSIPTSVRIDGNLINNSQNLKEYILETPIKNKDEKLKLVNNSIEYNQAKILSIENRGRYHKNKNNLVLNNCIDSDLTILPHIRNNNDLSLSPINNRNEKDNIEKIKRREESRNIVYNEKKVRMLLQKAGSQVSNNKVSSHQNEIHNKNPALLNKYYKNKVDNSYSPKGNQKYIKNFDYRQVLNNNKLPIIQNSRRMRVIQYKLI